MGRLDGRGVVVTGGGGHLGSAITLAAAAAGATVVACGRRIEPLRALADRHAGIVPVVADVSTDAGVTTAIDALCERSTLDGWVNNAYAGRAGFSLDTPREVLEDTVRDGLAGVLAATQLVAERMTRGSIVNVASMYGVVSPRPSVYAGHPESWSQPGYGAAKAGLVQFTRYAAVHLAPRGIRVNAVTPGAFPHGAPEDFVRTLEDQIPLGRIGAAEEVAGPVVFLLSEEASYVTGHNLAVDGGWTAW